LTGAVAGLAQRVPGIRTLADSTLARQRLDLVILPLALVVTLFLPHRTWGLYGLGTVTGAVYALNAIGIILVYRSNRIINFAQLAVGSVGAVLFAVLTTFDPLLRGVHGVCSTCLNPVPDWWAPFLFSVSAMAGVLVSTLMSYVAYTLVIRFLDAAPRLVVTVATLFFVSVCEYVISYIGDPGHYASQAQRDAQIPVSPPRAPFDWTLQLGLVRLHSADILVVLVVIPTVAVLTWYLRKSAAGVAIRAAAENPGRVASLGVNVRSVTGRVWLIAGIVSGLAGCLSAMGGLIPKADGALNVELIVRVLLITLFARFTSLPIAAVAAVVVGILQQCVVFAYGSPVSLDGALLGIIALTLLLQRAQRVRADVDTASEMRTAREIRPIPGELRHLPEVRKWLRIGAVTLTLILVVVPLLLSPRQTSLTSYAVIITMLFLSLLVLTGWAGQISLGQLAFAATGAWAAAVTGWPFPLPLIVGAVAGALLAAAAGIPGLKLKGLYLAIVTVALNLSVSTYLLNKDYLGSHLPDTVRRPSLVGMNLDNEQVFYYFAIVLLILVALAVTGMRRSTYARALIAARDNEAAAQVFGVNLFRARLSAFAMSGGIAGMAGSLIAYQQHGVISNTFAATESLQVFLFSALGGLGAVAAPLVSGALFVLAKLALSTQYVQLLTGAAGILLLIFTSGGVSEILFGIRDNLLRGVARRRKIVVPSLLADERADGRKPRLAIRPKTAGRGGATVFVAPRYRLDDQYALQPPVEVGAGEGR
jgi:branched-chain amino acid transport system permease protein